MQVLIHPDPVRLERELLTRVDRSHPRGSPGRTLVLVPTRRLVVHVQRRLAAVRSGWLGLEVLDLRGLAHRILESQHGPGLEVAPDRMLDALVRLVLKRQPDNPWARFYVERPGVIGRLREALSDLREASLTPALVERVAQRHDDRARGLARLYAAYHRSIESRRRAGWTDAAGLARAAVELAGPFAESWDQIYLHGAYELTGAQLELIRSVDVQKHVTALVPVSPGARSTSYAEEFLHYMLPPKAGPVLLDDGADGDRAARLTALYDEGARPPAAAAGTIRFRHTQGPVAEVEAALYEALRSVGDGVDPAEIAIVARGLEPYAAAIEEVFASHRVPFVSSLAGPLRRQPAVHDFLLLLQVLDEDFPRRPTVELLKSPRLAWSAILQEPERPPGELADAWSRRARIIGGLEEWTEELPRWAGQPIFRDGQSDAEREAAEQRAGQRAAMASRVARALDLLRHRLPLADRRWSEHADGLERLVEALLREPDDETGRAAVGALVDVIDEMRRLESFVGERIAVPFTRARGWLEEAIDATRIDAAGEDRGGIRVLDAMQARGHTFRELHLVGMNAAVFPRAPREDPVLPDALRRDLRERSSSPLPVKAAGAREEHLLLTLLLGSATDRIDVSWQRADVSGRARTPSLALREIGRLAHGQPRMPQDEADHLPSHPAHWLEHRLERTTLLGAHDRLLLSSLRAEGDAAMARLAERFPEIASGVRSLRATQAFRFGDPTYDGRVGPRQRVRELSVSAMELLGRCPLQFFFNRVLGVHRLDDAASRFDIAAYEMGLNVHDLLETIYRTLHEERLLEAEDHEPALERARSLLQDKAPMLLGDLGRRIGRRLPVLAEHYEQSWIKGLLEFLEWDLERIVGPETRPIELEQMRLDRIELGEGQEISVRGRLDRVLRLESGALRVGDYKTSGSLDRRISVTEMLKGRTLQVPLYSMMMDGAEVELLAVGPNFERPAAYRFDGFGEGQRESFLETLRALVGLEREGTYPLNRDKHCAWCDYADACRRNHPPTRDRERNSAGGQLLERIGNKNTRRLHGT